MDPKILAKLSEDEFVEVERLFRSLHPPSFESFLRQTVSFKPHRWQTAHLCVLLERMVHEKGLRILVHGPPQYGKSILVSKRFPAWALGINPLLRIVLAGYNVSHAQEFAEVVRDIMHSPSYAQLFPMADSHIPRTASSEGFKTLGRARLNDGQDSITPVGLLSGFTGKGADILLIDDPYASPDDARSQAINDRVHRWWNELAKVRISDDTNVLVMFHRYHENDLAGRLLAEGGFEYIRFPAIADENEDKSDPTGRKPGQLLSDLKSREFLQAIEDRNPQTWLGQFQGRPRAPEGGFIKRQYLGTPIVAEALPKLDLWVRFWDLATKPDQRGDFTSGALVGVGPDQTVYIRDVTRFRAEWPDACGLIAKITAEDAKQCAEAGAEYEVGVEKVAWMRAMIQDLFAQPVFKNIRLTPVPPNGKKKERASGWVARGRYDKVRLVLGHWNEEFIEECLSFDGEGTVHDDQVDGVSGAYELIWSLKGNLINEHAEAAEGSLEYYRQLIELNRPPPDEWGWGESDE